MPSSRRIGEDGCLYADAAIMRSGLFDYGPELRKQFGETGAKAETDCKVLKADESVFDPDTLAAIKGQPITLGHPTSGGSDGELNAATWGEVPIVGMVTGEAYRMDAERVGCPIRVCDKNAIKMIESGSAQEMSVGFSMTFEESSDPPSTGYDFKTVGPLKINHVALVTEGRAGPKVRVMDSKPVESKDESEKAEEDSMTLKEVEAAVASAVQANLKGRTENLTAADVAGAVQQAMAPVKGQVDALAKQIADDREAKSADEAKAKAETKAKEFENAIRTEERTRAAVFADAMPMIPEADRAALKDASVKEILVAAVGDKVPNAAECDEGYLRGAFEVMKADAKRNSTTASRGKLQSTTGSDAVTKARNDFIASQTDAWKGGND